jgi:SNF2 family DNA or RNA helicase
MDCPPDKILNETTGKCVKKSGRIGKAILAGTYVSKSEKLFEKTVCEEDEILNPITGKCVQRDGRIGKKILSGEIKLLKYDDCPPGKITYKSPDGKKKCISVHGKLAKALIAKNKLRMVSGDEIEDKKGDCISRSKLPLNEHQIKVINFMMNHRGLLIIHKVGTGKTLTAIATSQCLMDKYKKLETVVITPKSLQKNFQKEMENYGISPTNEKYYFFTYTQFYIHGQKQDLKEFMKNKLIIIDEVHNLKFKPNLFGDKKERKDEEERDPFSKMKAGKSLPSKVSKIFIEACKYAKKVLLLTATPVLNRPSEIINMIAMIDGTNPLTYFQFIGKIYGDNKKLLEFEDYFKCKISYYYPEDNSQYYPEVHDQEIEIEMPDEFYEEYYKLQEIEGIGKEHKNIENGDDKYIEGLFFSGLRQSINNLWGVYNPKLFWIQYRLLRNIKKNYKTLIYSSFKHKKGEKKVFMNHLIDFLKENNIPYGIISGDESKNKRNENVINYNKGELKVLLITKAGGEGLDLKETHDVIIVEPYWNKEFIKQIKGRAIRYKSHTKLPLKLQYVNVYQLLLVKPKKHKFPYDDMESVDTILYEASERKDKLLRKFYSKLEKMSIENNDC